MFAALTFDRDPVTTGDIPAGLLVWLQVVGGFAAIANGLYLPFGYVRQREADRRRIPAWLRLFFIATGVLGLACYAVALVFGLASLGREGGDDVGKVTFSVYVVALTASGVFFILEAGVPFLLGVVKMRFGRIYALAKLSFKEALRRRILYAFAGIILVFLFATWFLFDTKPEDEIRTYVELVFTVMALLLLPAAALISAFSLPADIKNQTIHTVVTKPVERFEIILGRFLGFLALMTLVLLALTAVSLVYVLRGVSREAEEESLKARKPQYGELRFEGTDHEKAGTNVGREWDYRSYITRANTGQEPQVARWTFDRVPGDLARRQNVRFEYTFDIYRTTRGEKEGADVTCTVRLYSWRFRPKNDEAYRKERGLSRDPALESQLAEKYGYHEITGLRVTDFHTQEFVVPQGLFTNINGTDADVKREPGQPDLTVRVSCESPVQYVGMARYDLYLRRDDTRGTDTLGFVLNFFKASFGLWLLLALVIGLSVVFSSHLSGVITLLVVATLFFCGLGKEFIQKVALNTNEGGGPAEAMLRIVRREISGAGLAESQSTTEKLAFYSDDTFRWVMRRILSIFPDVQPYFLTDYVAEGFDISWAQMGLGLLMLAGYLLPWFVLAYFLIRWREIAAPT